MASSPEVGLDDGQVRWPLVAKIGVGLAALTIVGGLVAALIAAFVVDRGDEPRRIIRDAASPVAPVALPDGDFLYAERTTGRVVRSSPSGDTETFSEIGRDLRTDGQRGLLGLAVRVVDARVEVYASWTRASDSRLVVGRISDAGARLVWEGPPTTDVANGGTLVFRGDQLLVGIGELQDPDAVADPARANGKVLALDPLGPPAQVPSVVLGGWHNPYALTVLGDDVWLVDNAPGSDPERVVRIASDGSSSVVELAGKRAPSSLAVGARGDLLLCGFVSETVERIEVPDDGADVPSRDVDLPCATGVTVLVDGAIVTTTVDSVWSG